MSKAAKAKSTKDKLKVEVLEGEWADLQPHAERSALFLLEPGHDIVEVGAAIVDDNVEMIDQLLNDGTLTRPSAEQTSQWDKDTSKPFRILIVAPYVLIQISPH